MSAFPKITINPVFASPIIQAFLPNTAALNEKLRSTFLQWENDKTRRRTSSPTPVVKVGVYESDFSLFQNPEAEVQSLATHCLQFLGYCVSQLCGYSDEQMNQLRIYHHSWYHLTRSGGYTAAHNHPMASWSGVYCVDPGDEMPDRPNNGALRFFEQRATAGMYLDPGNSQLPTPYGFGDVAYSLQAGQLLLFPSYMLHEVAPYYGQRERITVAFNAWFRYADQAVDEPTLKL